MAQVLAISMKRRVEVVHGELFSFSLLNVPKKLKTLDAMNLSPFAETLLDYGLSEEIEVNMHSDQVPDIKIVEEEEIDEAENMHYFEVPYFMAEEAEAAEMEMEDEREEFEEHNNTLQAPIFWTGFF
ncbi:uncharacterized protein LOC109724554 [Ananas comosus]|uniref:Uncharacterized protein LOC109724554 n=1 Tax=Ananas comosus TaxID=4615 RepID=A0A6P5GM19_ANACO|nr:uncharacterized protein LOC109724554 [Ananas comosus]